MCILIRYFSNFLLLILCLQYICAEITGLEYYIGSDPGEGNGISLQVVEWQDGVALAQTLELATSSLAPGTYDLGVRAMNGDGVWSNTTIRRFTVYNPNFDEDKDGLNNFNEIILGTRIDHFDSDTDGYYDGLEFTMRSDPNSSVDIPKFNGIIEVSGSTLRFTFPSKYQAEYIIEKSKDLLIWEEDQRLIGDGNMMGESYQINFPKLFLRAVPE